MTASSTDFATTEPGSTLILSGAAAAARGAFEAGVGLAVTYPGSPVVESFEVLASRQEAQYVVNEHVALHKALGFSLAGGRSLVIMKHVGLNVASDPAHYAGYTGVRGGMVLIVGFDPGANCSTGEFDCRLYSLHTHLPVLEPADCQEALDQTRDAFLLSEHLGLPVAVFIPSKLCYGMGTVITGQVREPTTELSFTHTPTLTNVGPRAVERHRLLMGKVARLENDEVSPAPPAGRRHIVPSPDLIVTSGIYGDFVLEALAMLGVEDRVSVYAPALTYPLSRPSLLSAINDSGCRRLVVVEDLEAFLELQVAGLLVREGKTLEVRGKDLFPPVGALDFQQVLDVLSEVTGARAEGMAPQEPGLLEAVHREGTFCPGCPHRALFDTLLDLLADEDIIGGDIGCSSLPPHFSDWLTCMNSGPSIASGVTLALGGKPRVVSLIGDSTFFHSGIQTVIECAQTNSNQVCFLLDNSWTAMTGHQPTPGTRRDVSGQRLPGALDVVDLLKACGVDDVTRVDPSRVTQLRRVVLEALRKDGFSCVVVERECKLQARRRARTEKWPSHFGIIEERCRTCNRCYSVLTCPAIIKNAEGTLRIDPDVCTGCSLCYQVCPNSAIIEYRPYCREADHD